MEYENYRDIIKLNIDGVYQDGIATKILQHMDRIRNMSDISQSRRWVMELLQNARDCSYKDTGVKVRIELKDNELIFSHSGKPFRIKDVLSIINQVTSKASSEETIGQFGTGFMTTFLLSDRVTINSVLKEEGLPYKPFTISMDRSSSDKDGILAGIAKTMSELERVDASEEITDFSKEGYNTVFSYPLKDSYHYNIAKTGFEDLKETILYVMLFSTPLKEIELISHEGCEKRISYTRGNAEAIHDDEEIWVTGLNDLYLWDLTIREKESINGLDAGYTDNHILYRNEGDLTIAASYDNERSFKSFSSKLPRIFADFPLIGAEGFPFPVVVNDRRFKVNEPRSGITLVDNDNSPDAAFNKSIIGTAALLYRDLLRGAIELEFKNIENIVDIPGWRESKEMSEAWIRANVYDQIYECSVSKEYMISTEKGDRMLSDPALVLPAPVVCLENETDEVLRRDPWEGQENKKKTLSELLSAVIGYVVPACDEKWLKAVSGYEQHKEKIITLRDVAIKAGEFLQKVDVEKMSPMEWLQKLYNACLEEESLKTAIAAGQIDIFPSQNEDDWNNKKLYNIGEIYLDNEIPEVLKDVTEELDKLSSTDALVLRKSLLHKDFKIGQKEMKPYPVERIIEYISLRAARSYHVQLFSSYQSYYLSAWHNAWNMLVSCGPDEDFYRMAVRAREGLEAYEPLGTDIFGKSMWKSTYCSMLEEIASEVEAASSLDGMIQNYSALQNADEVCQWINDYVNCGKNYLSVMSGNFYPDQKGRLQNLITLYRDTMNYEELKDIMEVFSDQDNEYDVRGKLLDKRIVNTFQHIQNYTDRDAASKIGNMIDILLANGSLSKAPDNYQEACGKLLSWIRNHIDEASVYFPSYCSEENQMKLLTPHAAVALQKKADKMEAIMKELEAATPEEFIEKLRELKEGHGSSGLSRDGFISEYDVFYGADLTGADEDVFREIGVGGEKYAFKQIVEEYEEKGFVVSEDDEYCYKLSGTNPETGCKEEIEVLYADSEHYHQPGYDIKVTDIVYFDDNTVDSRKTKVHFYEVKTHTPNSIVRDRIILSNEQMALAARWKENYSIISVVYDHRTHQGLSAAELCNPIFLIGEKELINSERYIFYLRKAA